MKDLFIVAKYTFEDLIKRKSFIISNIVILLIVIVGFNIPNIINGFKSNDEDFGETKLVIVDRNNLFNNNLEIMKQAETGYKVEIDNISDEEIEEKLKNEEINEALVITEQENRIEVKYVLKSISTYSQIPENLVSMIQEIYKNIQMQKAGLTQEQIESFNIPFETEMMQVDETEATGNIFIMMLMSLVLFYAIYFYAYQVSTSITTEKTSKIIETLVTSTSPRTIVLGKTIGIGLAGIIQTAILVIVAIICANVFLTYEMVSAVLDISNMTPMLAITTVIYYILGYSLFALLYALTGSTVSKPEDIQSANGPIAILAVIGFYLSYFTMMNPTSELNLFASMFPISSPFCMPFRVMMGIASITDVLISVAILLVTIFIIAKVSIKIYSSAILNYGSKINFKDMIKMYKNKD